MDIPERNFLLYVLLQKYLKLQTGFVSLWTIVLHKMLSDVYCWVKHEYRKYICLLNVNTHCQVALQTGWAVGVAHGCSLIFLHCW